MRVMVKDFMYTIIGFLGAYLLIMLFFALPLLVLQALFSSEPSILNAWLTQMAPNFLEPFKHVKP